MIAKEQRFAGHLARGACAKSIGFLVDIGENWVQRHFLPWIRDESRSAVTLRGVIAAGPNLNAAASRLLKSELLKAAKESKATGWEAQHVAAKILWPVLAPLIYSGPTEWGIKASDTRSALKVCPDAILHAAAQCFVIWQKNGVGLGLKKPGEMDLVLVSCRYGLRNADLKMLD